jgi:gas vesicle protein
MVRHARTGKKLNTPESRRTKMIAFMVGLFIGGVAGFFTLAILVAGKNSDTDRELNEAKKFLSTMDIILEECLAEANALANATPAFVSMNEIKARAVTLGNKIQRTLDEYNRP